MAGQRYTEQVYREGKADGVDQVETGRMAVVQEMAGVPEKAQVAQGEG